MNPYIGDRSLDPPEDDGCETCGGGGALGNSLNSWNSEPCPDCCYDSDPGEPNDEPDL